MKLLFNFLLIGIVYLNISISVARPKGEYPPSIVELTIRSQGKRMSGLAYLAQGKGPHPTVLLLHGYPGNEKNLDLAQELRSGGWNVVFFHYRGSWGSEGEFSFLGAEQDVQSVLSYMMQKENTDKLRIDAGRISTVGHSMGGHMALAGILDNPSVRCAVSLDGTNLGVLATTPEELKAFSDYSDGLFMLKGWSGQKSQKEKYEHKEELNLLNKVQKIAARPILFIPANSKVISMDRIIKPLIEALKATPGSQVQTHVIEDDHSFSASRKQLIDTTLQFLDSNCK